MPDLQITLDGDEVPHEQVVKQSHPKKRRAVSMEHIDLIAGIIRDAEFNLEEDRQQLALAFGMALVPMNSKMRLDRFMEQCGAVA